MSTASERTQLLRVGDLSRSTGKSVRAIHLYEELGLLQPATRSSGGFRLYDPAAVERVRWISLLHGLGFSLHEMRALVRSWWGAGIGPRAMEELRALFEKKLAETREAVRRHQQLEGELIEGLAYLETCRRCDTASGPAGCTTCTHDHGMHQEPALVAGITNAPAPARRGERAGFVRIEDVE